MGFFDKIKEPIILKEDSSATQQLIALQELAISAPKEVAAKMEQDIKLLNAGIYGENNILFELKNSHMPMVVLHDLFLQYEGLSAQIDFLIVTRGCTFVLECKNLIGNIEITSDGDFIRTVSYNGRYTKEGIYSPITQNQRHLQLIKQMRSAERTNVLSKAMFEKYFFENYRSVVVLANPKTVLNAKYAKKEVKAQVIKADQLIAYMKKINSEPDTVKFSETDMLELADYFLAKHQPHCTDYIEKYKEAINAAKPKEVQVFEEVCPKPVEEPMKQITESEAEQTLCPKCKSPMVKRKAKRGENAGKEFYGCSSYPKCRTILDI